jgi:8-oxo-dGTP pyrophosphatase MutT (NUDIX family)
MPIKYNPRWKTLKSRVAHQNPWYKVYCNKVVRPDGKKGDYFIMNTPGPSVFVVAVNAREEVCMIHIDRYPVAASSWEIPGGNTEGQNLLVAAKRELEEETGWKARSWKKAGKWLPMNGVCPEIAHVFIATGLYPAAEKKDSRGEGIRQVLFIPARKALEMSFAGKIIDGQTVAGLFLAGQKRSWFRYKK